MPATLPSHLYSLPALPDLAGGPSLLQPGIQSIRGHPVPTGVQRMLFELRVQLSGKAFSWHVQRPWVPALAWEVAVGRGETRPFLCVPLTPEPLAVSDRLHFLLTLSLRSYFSGENIEARGYWLPSVGPCRNQD